MKGLPRSRARGSQIQNSILKKTVAIRSKALTVNGATGNGFGTVVVDDFPQGNILLLGAVSNLKVETASSGVTATFTGSYALGTTPTADATLSGTDANIVQATTLNAATAKVSPITRGVTATGAVVLDNTDGSLELNLNLVIDDAGISADDVAFIANGEAYISFVVLGDD